MFSTTKNDKKFKKIAIIKWFSKRDNGYLLPVVIVLGLGISVLSTVALQTIANNSSTLAGQQYKSIAKEAAKAGIATAINCIQSTTAADRNWTGKINSDASTWTGNELISKSCAGVANSPTAPPVSSYDKVANVSNSYYSTYKVDGPVYGDTDPTTTNDAGTNSVLITAIGTVTKLGPGGVKIGTVTQTVRAFALLGAKRNVLQVSAGPTSACAIATESDGQSTWPYCWGNNSSNQLGQGPSAQSEYDYPTAVAGRRNGLTTITVTTNAGRYCQNPWGTVSLFPNYGFGYCPWPFYWVYTGPSINQVAVPNGLQNADGTWKYLSKISVGTNHTCVLAKDTITTLQSKAYCWGDNTSGELGTRDFYSYPIPVNVDTRAAWTTTTANSICDGALVSVPTGFAFVPYWPFIVETSSYQLCVPGPLQAGWTGSATFDNAESGLHDHTVSTAAADTTSRNVLDISAGNDFTCALSAQTTGTTAQQAQSRFAQCWGKNDNGQLGTADRTYRNAPSSVLNNAAVAGQAGYLTCDPPNIDIPASYTPTIYIPPVYVYVPFVGWVMVATGYYQPGVLIYPEQCSPYGWTSHPGWPAVAQAALYGKTITAIATVKGANTMCVLAVDPSTPTGLAQAQDPNYHGGQAYCWGENYAGNSTQSSSQLCALGYPTIAASTSQDVLTPTLIGGGMTFDSIELTKYTSADGSTTGIYAVAKTPASANRIYTWGSSTTATHSPPAGLTCTTTRTYTAQSTPQLMYSTTGNVFSSTQLRAPASYTAGNGFAGNPLTGLFCGLDASVDKVYCDSAGSGNDTNDATTKVTMNNGPTDLMASGRSVVSLDVGSNTSDNSKNYACAVTVLGASKDGEVGCWGVNDHGQLGLGTNDASTHATPSPVSVSNTYSIDTSSVSYALTNIVYF